MPAQWKNLLRLADYGDHLKALLADFIGNTAVFKEWYDLEMPETTDIPLGHHEMLSTLEVGPFTHRELMPQLEQIRRR
jgi:hypothetical protein